MAQDLASGHPTILAPFWRGLGLELAPFVVLLEIAPQLPDSCDDDADKKKMETSIWLSYLLIVVSTSRFSVVHGPPIHLAGGILQHSCRQSDPECNPPYGLRSTDTIRTFITTPAVNLLSHCLQYQVFHKYCRKVASAGGKIPMYRDRFPFLYIDRNFDPTAAERKTWVRTPRSAILAYFLP